MSEQITEDDVENPYTNVYTRATDGLCDEIIVIAVLDKYWVFHEVCYFLANDANAPEAAQAAFQTDRDTAHLLAKDLTERYASAVGSTVWTCPDVDPWDEDRWGERYSQNIRDYVSAMFEADDQGVEILATVAAHRTKGEGA